MYLYPNNELSVRDPDLLDLLPVEGREVPPTDYWLRRKADGDVTTTPPVSAPTNPPAKAKKGGE
jgi:hypothetical protein